MSVIKRSNSKNWYIQFQFHGITVIRSARTTNKQKALAYEKKVRDEVMSEIFLGERKPITLGNALEQYQQSKKELASHKSLLSNIRFITSVLDKDKPVHLLTNTDLDSIVEARRQNKQSNYTIKHTLNVLRGALKLAKRRNSKVTELEFPSVPTPKHRLRYLSLDEEKRLIEELDPYRERKSLPRYKDRRPELIQQLWDIHDLVIVLLDTGARLNEIQTLQWKHVDLNKKIIHLWRSKTQSETLLHMTDRLYNTLISRYDNSVSDQFIFTAKDGGPRKYARNAIKKAFERAGLMDFRIHDLRHTTASRLIQNGLTLFEVAQILGHSSPSTTARYAHLERSHVSAKAAMVLNSLNGGDGRKITFRILEHAVT